MTAHALPTPASLALFTPAQIKAAAEAFESGDVNVYETLDEIVAAPEPFRAAAFDRCRQESRPWNDRSSRRNSAIPGPASRTG